MLRLVALAAMACVVAATTETQDSRFCAGQICDDLDTFKERECRDYEIARKIFQAGAMDPCCPVFKCEIDPDQPCEAVRCKTPNNDQSAQDQWCNENIFPDDQIWNDLSPDYQTKYAVLIRPAADRAGRCCDEFRCKTDYNALCNNLNQKTPCPGEETCPLCHFASVRTPKNPEEGRCCDEIACIKNDACLCDERDEGTNCPEPNCVPLLQYPVTIVEADPSMGRCCPQRSCQNDLTQICIAEANRRGFDITTVCGECEMVQIIEEADYSAGKCFPTYKCIPVPDACCGIDPATDCPAGPPSDVGVCQEYIVDNDAVSCCTEYKLVNDLTCLCNLKTIAEPCEYTTAEEFRLANCPEETREKSGNGVPLYTVKERFADPSEGRCCDQYSCIKTSTAQLEVLRRQKGPLPGPAPTARP